MNYYEYHITIWDDEDARETFYQGVVPANNYSKAIDALVEYYGEDAIVLVSLECWTEGVVLSMTQEALKDIKMNSCI